jgi:FkbM family methyltransferase
VPRAKKLLRALLRPTSPETARGAHARAAFWDSARSMTPYVAAQHRGIVYLVPTVVGPKFFLDGGRAEFVVLERACKVLGDAGRLEGRDTIVDVGAHIGTTSIAAVRSHGFARAVAIEPDPAHLPLLRANVALNGLDDRIAVVPAAMSRTQGSEQPFVQGIRKDDTRRWMKGRLVAEDNPGAIPVDTVSLDALVERGVIEPASTGLLWFDCAGCEHHALDAAVHLLEQRMPLVFPVRRSQFTPSSPLLERLRRTYARAIDLRHPSLADPVSDWSPVFRGLDELSALPAEGKKLTDVLVF